jgi:thioredoxin-like negative regulator of GroEL
MNPNDMKSTVAPLAGLEMQTTASDVEPRRRWTRYVVVCLCLGALLVGSATGVWQWYRRSVIRSLPLRIAQAELLLRSGKTAQAKNSVATILQFVPDDFDARSVLGRCLIDEGNTDEGIHELAAIPPDSSAFLKSGFVLATAYLQTSDLEHAESVLKSYLERLPESEEAREELQWLCFNQFRPREVVQLLQDKLPLVPGDPKTLAGLLDSEYRQQVPFEGADYLAQVDRTKPGQSAILLALGYAKWRMGQVEAARPLFQQALAARPDDPHTRLLASSFLLEQGDLGGAEQILDRGPVLSNDDRYWALKSQISEQKNLPAVALTQLEQAIQRHPYDHRYASRRASLLRKLGRGNDAESASRTAFDLLTIDRQFADIVESRIHQQPTKGDAIRFSKLYEQVGKKLEAQHWRILADRLPEGKSSP